MEVVAEPASSLEATRSFAESHGSATAITIGTYDGCHVGHRALLSRLREQAAKRGLPAVAVTFDRHPLALVRPEAAPKLLTTLGEKLELLAESGIDATIVLPFDERRREESARDFVDEVLVSALHSRLVVVGENFRFGHDRDGSVASLAAMGEDRGFAVMGVPLAVVEGEPVSSTRIRGVLESGDVRLAALLLGRPYSVRGEVEKGDGRAGSMLGYPTANCRVPKERLLPREGIYAGFYRRFDGAGDLRRAAISVGRRPTFYPGGAGVVVEAHLLDFHGDLYGEMGEITFVERLRDEEAFEEVEALVSAMRSDVARVRRVLDGL